ncbi:hypothetical protein [Thermogemmatispora tikiterensis]|uniref:Uncharacterized protein n=1 Tax=Thermogemmatispora tikiterensis TaxID=1825093 RepID=A0A328VGE6_9CHLR|nr:hypothetical protein [Thermogemmatispora tikiterensis]RAQ94683.1 hypothetical protein A4R35_03990 [Thermogemmatispora tikiterensis]
MALALSLLHLRLASPFAKKEQARETTHLTDLPISAFIAPTGHNHEEIIDRLPAGLERPITQEHQPDPSPPTP